jgi:hypothetical protein
LPHDQREDDGGALVFESPVLDEDLEILGAPVVRFELCSNKPVAMVAVRLSDAAPNDQATRVTYGLLNLTHRSSHESPEPLEPGARYRVQVPMNHVAQRFPAGHRVRLSVSTSYWPLAWPAPEPARLTIYAGRSSLSLPRRARRESDERLRPLGEPEGTPPIGKTLLHPGEERWRVIRELGREVSYLEVVNDIGRFRLDDIDLEITGRAVETYTYRGEEYDSLSGETVWTRSFRRGAWSVRTVTRTLLTANATHFRIRADLDAWEGQSRVFSKSWDSQIPRDLV